MLTEVWCHYLTCRRSSSLAFIAAEDKNISLSDQPDILYIHYGNLGRKAELCVTYNPPGKTVPARYNLVRMFYMSQYSHSQWPRLVSGLCKFYTTQAGVVCDYYTLLLSSLNFKVNFNFVIPENAHTARIVVHDKNEVRFGIFDRKLLIFEMLSWMLKEHNYYVYLKCNIEHI